MEPDHSIGPGVCEAACPVEAIQPVFRTEKCGIDHPIRHIDRCNQRPCIFLAGAEPDNSSASRAATEYGVRFTTVEQDDPLGGLSYHSPRRKLARPVT